MNTLDIKPLFYFYVYAFLGWIIETLYCTLKNGRFVNRGLLQGPFVPIYGAGGILFILLNTLLPELKFPAWKILIFAMAASFLEYYTSVILENLFQMRLWDYSEYKVHIHGRISPYFSAVWGVLGFLQITYLQPFLETAPGTISQDRLSAAVLLVTVYFLFDLLFSVEAVNRFSRLVEQVKQEYLELKDFKWNFHKFRLLHAFPNLRSYINEGISENVRTVMKDKLSSLVRDRHLSIPSWQKEGTNSMEHEFLTITGDILKNENFLKLKSFKHHDLAIYDHARAVAFLSYKIAKKTGLNARSTARGALMHDFFFYDWRYEQLEREGKKKFHAFEHPKIALRNAEKNFQLNKIEKDIILHHMWPLTLKLPRYRESFLVSFIDKFVSTKEIIIDQWRPTPFTPE